MSATVDRKQSPAEFCAEKGMPAPMTPEQLCEFFQWGNPDAPTCCGQRVSTTSFIIVYAARCEKCGRSARTLSGPWIDGACAGFLDDEKIDLEDPRQWVISEEWVIR